MVPYRYDPEHIAPANAAPRCQYIKLSGHRCGAPARRRRRFCYFHERIVYPKRPDYAVRFIEDATSLQFALMQVLNVLQGPRPDYKACALSLYALQIACSNLKGFISEQPKLELMSDEQPEPKPTSSGKEKPVEQKNGEEPSSLAELLLGFLAKGPNGDPDAPPPRIRNREDYYAAVEQRRQSAAALPGETATG